MNYIESIKEELDKCLHNKCVAFMVIGTPSETPRYMNFGDFDNETKTLTIQSTQTNRVSFDVQTDYDFIEVNKFWKQFRDYRTQFLLDNYPTINPY